jgi:cytochrome c-type biogenesis protein CcmH/NrfF
MDLIIATSIAATAMYVKLTVKPRLAPSVLKQFHAVDNADQISYSSLLLRCMVCRQQSLLVGTIRRSIMVLTLSEIEVTLNDDDER